MNLDILKTPPKRTISNIARIKVSTDANGYNCDYRQSTVPTLMLFVKDPESGYITIKKFRFDADDQLIFICDVPSSDEIRADIWENSSEKLTVLVHIHSAIDIL
ncbi:MAG: hypothetical protein K0S38_845 [Candidatus Paceibacter sp.]|jgi:hypothetical protein|nr:hypothetical protein [Candidatus Paceibacter sp.]